VVGLVSHQRNNISVSPQNSFRQCYSLSLPTGRSEPTGSSVSCKPISHALLHLYSKSQVRQASIFSNNTDHFILSCRMPCSAFQHGFVRSPRSPSALRITRSQDGLLVSTSFLQTYILLDVSATLMRLVGTILASIEDCLKSPLDSIFHQQ